MTTTNGYLQQAHDSVFDVVVIGGGQSGLAIGRQLQQRGRSFLIVDAGPDDRARLAVTVETALTLFTAGRFSGLPGLPFPGDPDGYPTKDAVAQYLRRYAATFGLPIRHEHAGHPGDPGTEPGFSVHTDGETFHAAEVVVASRTVPKPGDPGGRRRRRPGHRAAAQLGVPQPRTAPRRAGPGRRRRQLRCPDRGRTAPDPDGDHRERGRHPLSAATDPGPRPVLVALTATGLFSAPAESRLGRRFRNSGELVIGTSTRSAGARPVSPCAPGSPGPTPPR